MEARQSRVGAPRATHAQVASWGRQAKPAVSEAVFGPTLSHHSKAAKFTKIIYTQIRPAQIGQKVTEIRPKFLQIRVDARRQSLCRISPRC